MSKAEYPNRNALDDALQVYLRAMYSFVSECLGEELLREALRLPSDSNIEKEIEVKDIAHLIRPRTRWEDYFKKKFEVTDRYGKIRYYDAQSVTSLIVEGRNQVSHPPWDLDLEFTRAQLFLIAEVLGKINRPDAQREVETIRNDLFENTTQQLVEMAVEEEKAQHKKSIAKVKERLAAEKESNKELSKQVDDNTTELDKRAKKLDELSEQLFAAKENKKQLTSTSRQLKKVQAAHSKCAERLTSTEAERDNYKECFETASKDLKEAETEWQACEDSLAAMRNLFTVSTIGNMVFPPFETDSTVRILDRRNVDKQNYLLNLLEQKQPTVIYVQSEERIDQLLTLVGQEKADVIGKCNERTSEAEEVEILEKLENEELIAVVSNTVFSTLASPHRIEHFVFCHLVPGLDEFFKQCEPAFASEKHAYLHLIYDSEQDTNGLAQKYPNREVLVEMYRELRKLAGTNGDFIKTENAYSELDMEKPSIETGIAIFAELQLLERNGEIIKFLPSVNTDLNKSTIHRRGEQLKEETADFQAFQLERSIEQIWEEILTKLNLDSAQILRENYIHNVGFKVLETKVDVQSTMGTEQDKVTPPTPEVWPRRTLSAFDSLRQRASKNLYDTNNSIQSIGESTELNSPVADQQFREADDLDFHAPDPTGEYDDYENKYDLAMQFVQEHGVNALKQGIALLIENQGNPDYGFTEDETNMLRAFQNACEDSQTQSNQFTETVESSSIMSGADTEVEHVPKPARANAKVTEEQLREIQSRSEAGESNSELATEFNLSSTAIRFVVETTEGARNEIAVKVVELRINEEGSKPIAWKNIREKLGLKEDQFHKVIRPSEGYRTAVIERIKSLKSTEGGWEYNGKLSVLTGIEDIENYLE